MEKVRTKRLSPQEMRVLLKKNAKVLLSESNRTSAPELSGEKKQKTPQEARSKLYAC